MKIRQDHISIGLKLAIDQIDISDVFRGKYGIPSRKMRIAKVVCGVPVELKQELIKQVRYDSLFPPVAVYLAYAGSHGYLLYQI